MDGPLHGQGTYITKMGADKSAENTQNDAQIVCPSPKVWEFDKKGFIGRP